MTDRIKFHATTTDDGRDVVAIITDLPDDLDYDDATAMLNHMIANTGCCYIDRGNLVILPDLVESPFVIENRESRPIEL